MTAFVLISRFELEAVRPLSDFAYRLFCELLALANHKTGDISTTYALLEQHMTPQQRSGAHKTEEVTTKRLRTAVAVLVSAGVLWMRKTEGKGLFLRVLGRGGVVKRGSANDGGKGSISEGGKGRVDLPMKTDPKEGEEGQGQKVEEGQEEGQAIYQEGNINKARALEAFERLRQQMTRSSGGKQQTPEGVEQSPAYAGHAPQGDAMASVSSLFDGNLIAVLNERRGKT